MTVSTTLTEIAVTVSVVATDEVIVVGHGEEVTVLVSVTVGMLRIVEQ